MRIEITSITGIPDAVQALYVSKNSLTDLQKNDIRDWYSRNFYTDTGEYAPGKILPKDPRDTYMDKLCHYGKKHITLLRFIDFTCYVSGLHRGGQDDWDSHASRFDNRII